MSDKSRIRRTGRRARLALGPAECDDLSLDIAAHVFASRLFLRAGSIGCYLPMAEEVNAWPVIERAWRMKKRIFAPVLEKRRRMRFVEISARTILTRNAFGLLEPGERRSCVASRLDLVLTPLVAFDAELNRIGMGGGYYDRAFSFLRHRQHYRRPKLVGLAFACQQVEYIDASPWDIPLFQIYTENGNFSALHSTA